MNNFYVLLTAAKNEETYIGETIASVLRQTIRPMSWFIMDDGSTDRTAGIVQDFARTNPWIHLVKREAAVKRNFGAQYRAIQAGYELAQTLDFDLVGVQDADIAPKAKDYYESMLGKFRAHPKLGIAGGFIYERYGGVWRNRKGNSPDSVAGGIQMFRRACFEQIGGYKPLPYGGADWLAQIDARMAGWEVLACPEQPILHYRPTSSADGRVRGAFQVGKMDASVGSDGFFELLKCARRLGTAPFLIGPAARFAGFLWWKFTGQQPLIPEEKVAFLRKSQRAKFRQWIRKLYIVRT